MSGLFGVLFVMAFAALVAAASATVWMRRRASFMSDRPVVDDRVIEQIIEHGEVFVEEDEPLDMREIDDEEKRFWSESWDEPGSDW